MSRSSLEYLRATKFNDCKPSFNVEELGVEEGDEVCLVMYCALFQVDVPGVRLVCETLGFF